MMNTLDKQHTTTLDDLMSYQASNFTIEQNACNEPIYHWVDDSITSLSTEKLEDIIRLSELPDCDVDDTFLDNVIIELLCRRSGF